MQSGLLASAVSDAPFVGKGNLTNVITSSVQLVCLSRCTHCLTEWRTITLLSLQLEHFETSLHSGLCTPPRSHVNVCACKQHSPQQGQVVLVN